MSDSELTKNIGFLRFNAGETKHAYMVVLNECPTCVTRGTYYRAVPMPDKTVEIVERPCPTCSGLGIVLTISNMSLDKTQVNQDTEQLPRSMHPDTYQCCYYSRFWKWHTPMGPVFDINDCLPKTDAKSRHNWSPDVVARWETIHFGPDHRENIKSEREHEEEFRAVTKQFDPTEDPTELIDSYSGGCYISKRVPR